jgi:hypothetical protein
MQKAQQAVSESSDSTMSDGQEQQAAANDRSKLWFSTGLIWPFVLSIPHFTSSGILVFAPVRHAKFFFARFLLFGKSVFRHITQFLQVSGLQSLYKYQIK